MTRLEESVAVNQRQLADDQSALLTVECECDKYRRRFGIEEQRRDGLEALLRGLRSSSGDHTLLVDSVRGILRQDMGGDLDVYLQAIFAAVRDCTVVFCSATSNVVETHGATLRQDVLSTPTHLGGRLEALAAETLITTASDSLGTGEARAP